MLFDTHAHYDDPRFDKDRFELLDSMPAKGVSLILNPASNLNSARRVMEYIDRFPHVFGAVGTHPHDAAGMKDEDIAEFREMARNPKIRAIGEIGLDYYYDHSPRETQKLRLRHQLALAEELGLPVIIHDRDAHEDTLNILREFPAVRGVVHCYSGSTEMAEALVKMGYYISFTGVITYKNARKSLDVIRRIPLDRIMIETDAPYLSPEPMRGRRNDSALVRLVAEKIAEVLETGFNDIAELTMQNGKEFFSI